MVTLFHSCHVSNNIFHFNKMLSSGIIENVFSKHDQWLLYFIRVTYQITVFLSMKFSQKIFYSREKILLIIWRANNSYTKIFLTITIQIELETIY